MIVGHVLRDLIGRIERQARDDRRDQAIADGTPTWLLYLAPGMDRGVPVEPRERDR